MNNNQNEIMIYEDNNGVTKVNVKFIDEDIWMTKHHIADIYKTKPRKRIVYTILFKYYKNVRL